MKSPAKRITTEIPTRIHGVFGFEEDCPPHGKALLLVCIILLLISASGDHGQGGQRRSEDFGVHHTVETV